VAADIVCSPLTICSRVGNTLHLLDPMTLQQTDVSAPVYWRQPFESLATVSDLVEFIVLDVEPIGTTRGKYVLADAQVTRASSSGTQADDEGMGDDGIYHTRTHLGGILQPGDTVLGYHLTNANFNNEAFESLDANRIPNVVLVKKTYPNRRKKNRTRNWKLRSIAKEAEDVNESAANVVGRGALGRRGGLDQKNVERDYELFLRDLEEDRDMRAAINLYRADQKPEEEEDGEDVQMGGARSKPGSGMRGGKRRTGAGGARADAGRWKTTAWPRMPRAQRRMMRTRTSQRSRWTSCWSTLRRWTWGTSSREGRRSNRVVLYVICLTGFQARMRACRRDPTL
jgi:nonsense-mediated mRNA decay protein 3